MNRIAECFFVALICPLMAYAESKQVQSPDGKLIVDVTVENGLASYSVSYGGQQMLQSSRLGLMTNYADFTKGLSMKTTKERLVEKSYDMTRTKASHSDFKANELVISIENEKKLRMDVTFMVANNDVALRYTLYRGENDNPKSGAVKKEITSFRLPDGTTTFLSPQSAPMVGWERTKPSYEEVYSADAAMTDRSAFSQGYVFPALFHLGDKGWVLISETGVNGSYVGSHLSDFNAETGYSIAFPMEGEMNGVGTTTAGIPLPYSTPWRTITVGSDLCPIVETTISYDVVDPLYEPSQVYKLGRYTWSWLIWQDNSINYDDQVKFVDLAASMGYEYCLVDNWWDQRIGRERMAELSKYAQQKGVSLMLWYNSNGYENDAPQTPRQCMNTGMARDKEMAWLKEIGVKGIKVDFFGGDKQQTMQLYEDILFDANRYGLQVIFHGCTLPRGWERMYPNYVASEAVLASENVMFTEEAALREPFDLTLHPFCRNATASMDWGGVIINRFMERDNKSRHSRKTTDVFEMASGITMQTAVQCVAIQPNNLSELPTVELDFLKMLPTTWDETRFVDGYPGSYVVLARRHGTEWYVAGLNAKSEPMKLTIQLPMFAGQKVSYYTDNKEGYAELRQLKVDKRGQAKVVMQPNGGFIIKN